MATNSPATKDGGSVQSPTLTQRFHAMMLERATVEDNSERAAEIAEQQAERIMSAESLDDILGADSGGTVQCRDVPNTEWEIRGYRVIRSNRTDIENSAGYYISMDAVCLAGPDDTLTRAGVTIGEQVALQTGAYLLMVKVRALEVGGYLPQRLYLLGTKTQQGFTILKWTAPPKRAQ